MTATVVSIDVAYIHDEHIVVRCRMSDGSIRAANWSCEDFAQFSGEVTAPGEQVPLFESLNEAADAFGWDAETTEHARQDMELGKPREPGELLH